ncbi:trypsin [Trichuris suis]|nr:trypsin [Trichuris suis]
MELFPGLKERQRTFRSSTYITYFLVTLVRPCGIPAIAPKKTPAKEMHNRIAYGWQARRNSLPWMVFIIILKEGEVNCNGFLVDNGSGYQSDIVVTAAHCVSSRTQNIAPSKMHVVLGAHELRDVEPTMVYRQVKNYATHFYNYDDDDNDITLLKLTSPVNYTKEISPLCLPTKHTTNRVVNSCFAAGWGRTENGSTSLLLKQTRVRIAPLSQCYFAERAGRALCVREYYNQSIPCIGDSGSPLFCEIDGRYFALGILSLGPTNCSQQEDPSALYVRMDNYHEWTLNTMKQLETAQNRTDDDVGEVKIRVESRLTLPGLLSLVPKRDKSKSLTGLELIALLSGYHKRRSNY